MIGKVSAKYTLRSLSGHPVRSLLSMLGIGIGCSIALLAVSWISGAAEMQIRAVSESGAGHLRVVPNEWLEKRENSTRLADVRQTLEQINSLPGVKCAAARARSNGLLAFGNRMAGVEVTGVDPLAELRSNRIVYRATVEGRYLRPDDSDNVVIGRGLAGRLDVELDDDLYLTLAGRDEIRSAMLRIVGILETGSRDLNASICHVTVRDLERITGYEGPGEISILIEDYRLIEPTQKELSEKLAGTNAVITWKEVNPGLAGNVEGDKAFLRGLAGIIVIVVSLGIASAQLTAVLERRHEFAILSALGMKGQQIIGLVSLEALTIGLGGAIVSLVLGGVASYYLATRGVSLAAFMGDGMSFGDVLLDPYIYGTFGVWLIWYALGISVTATVLVSIYPAWLATKVEPAEAMRIV
ncbi:MAG: ABC transporter permease [Candidatus Hydrogenedentota bacterium]|nr:MAG: ABC transporter permease [Candidatus Hydrogenedentota bacterium]